MNEGIPLKGCSRSEFGARPLPSWASMSTDLFTQFVLESRESGVILYLPSRFGGGSGGGDGHRVFWRRAPKKNGARLLRRVCDRQTICLRELGDDRAEKVKFRRFLMNERVTVPKMVTRQRARVAVGAASTQPTIWLPMSTTSRLPWAATTATLRPRAGSMLGPRLGRWS